MKTSNIILVTLIGGITFVILAGALQLRFTGTKKSALSEVSSTVDLKAFNHIIIRNSVNLRLVPSEEIKMVVWGVKGEADPTIAYRESGDTLIIDEIRFGRESRSMSVTIELPQHNLRTVSAEKSYFILKNFETASLQIHLKESRLTMEGDRNLRMERVNITGKAESQIYMGDISIDTVQIQLNNSHARIPGRVSRLAGSIENHSTIFAPKAANIVISKDSLSRWQN